MPKYFDFKICGYYLYFTTHCVIEAMHAHASDGRLSEGGSAKFFVRANGDTVVQNRGKVSDADVRRLQRFIKDNYEIMLDGFSVLFYSLHYSSYDLTGFIPQVNK